jgi:hypothetical protein
LIAACGGDDGVGGRPSSGGLGQVDVAPECGALSQACIGQGLDAPIVLGSSLELLVSYRVPGTSGPPTTIASADRDVIEVEGATTLRAVGEGMSALLFVGPEGEVMDILHVWVAPPSNLRIQRYTEAGDLLGQVQTMSQLLVGDEIFVAVEPYTNGQALLGNFAMQYTSSSSAVAIVPDPVAAWYRVVAREPGMATVSFAALGQTAAWQIEVLP